MKLAIVQYRDDTRDLEQFEDMNISISEEILVKNLNQVNR